MSTVNTQEDAIALMLCYKPAALRAALVAIVRTALESEAELWPDAITFDLAANDKNAIGNSFKTLLRAKIVERTGAWRASKAESHKGRTIFGYRLVNANLARTFLKRNGAVAKVGQLEML